MRKIPRELENPIDNVLLDVCEAVAPIFHRTGHTPNGITTYSLLAGMAAVRCVVEKKRAGFAGFMALSYFLDCLDGHMARKYDQVTRFGDIYDHVKDTAVTLAVGVALYRTVPSAQYKTVVPITLFGYAAMLIHLGCQQHHYTAPDDIEMEMLDSAKFLCRHPEHARYTRYFGSGTFMMGFIALIYLNIPKRAG